MFKKIFWSGLVAGVVMLAVSFAVSFLFSWAFPSLTAEYMNGMYRPWSDPLMQMFVLGPILLGFVLAGIWNKVKSVIGGCKYCGAGIHFGFVYWLVMLPGLLLTYSSYQMSLLMIVSWAVGGLLQALAAGWILLEIVSNFVQQTPQEEVKRSFTRDIRTDWRFTNAPAFVANLAPRIFSSDGEKKL